jgi:hypothetical protein
LASTSLTPPLSMAPQRASKWVWRAYAMPTSAVSALAVEPAVVVSVCWAVQSDLSWLFGVCRCWARPSRTCHETKSSSPPKWVLRKAEHTHPYMPCSAWQLTCTALATPTS